MPGTFIFFGTYEFTKRNTIAYGCPETISHLFAGLLGDLFASAIYVPSEVLKTRLQLQGRYNNPHFKSGYNYRSTVDAARTIIREEGGGALFHGYKATLVRDLPFSALQFAFYERFKAWAHRYTGTKDVGLEYEVLTGSTAGGLAGMITTPLDVVKTRIQTQLSEPEGEVAVKATKTSSIRPTGPKNAPIEQKYTHLTAIRKSIPTSQVRHISTASPSTSTPLAASYSLTSSHVIDGVRQIYRHEGIRGLFRGIGPRTAYLPHFGLPLY